MRHFTFSLLILFACTLMAQQAHALWSVPVAVNNASRAASNPSCANVATDVVVCAVRNDKQQLNLYVYDGGVWSNPVTPAPKVSSDPSCTVRGTEEVVCVVLNASSGLSYTIYNGGSWSPLAVASNKKFASSPSCARVDADSIACAVRATDIAVLTLNGAVWSKVKFLTANAISQPSCASDSDGKVICMALDATSQPVATRYSGTSWQAVIALGGRMSNAPTCASNGTPGVVLCIARNSANNTPLVNRFSGATWQAVGWAGWTASAGGVVLQSRISCAARDNALLSCNAISIPDNKVYSTQHNGASWGTFFKIDDTVAIRDPSCATLNDTKVLCVFVDLDNHLLSRTGP